MDLTSAFRRNEGSQSSQATFLRSEHVLKRSWASGWKTEKTVVSLTEMTISEDTNQDPSQDHPQRI